jgi:hypothetical protein
MGSKNRDLIALAQVRGPFAPLSKLMETAEAKMERPKNCKDEE